MEKIEAYKTSDDELFFNEAEALEHENAISLKAWYEDHPICIEYGATIDWDDVEYWLKENNLYSVVQKAVSKGDN